MTRSRAAFFDSGRRVLLGAALLGAVAAGGCPYGLTGGGGLPAHVNTLYVAPIENETPRFVLTGRLTEDLLEAARDRMGAQIAGQSEADAIVRASITGFRDDALDFQAREDVGAEVFERRVTVTASVEIVDVTRDEIIWSSSSVSGQGEYAPGEDPEDIGIDLAIEDLVQRVVDGAQSQW